METTTTKLPQWNFEELPGNNKGHNIRIFKSVCPVRKITQRTASLEVFTALPLRIQVFWDIVWLFTKI